MLIKVVNSYLCKCKVQTFCNEFIIGLYTSQGFSAAEIGYAGHSSPCSGRAPVRKEKDLILTTYLVHTTVYVFAYILCIRGVVFRMGNYSRKYLGGSWMSNDEKNSIMIRAEIFTWQ